MSKEILMVVDAVSNEKGVEKDIIFGAIEAALASATRRKHGEDIEVRVQSTVKQANTTRFAVGWCSQTSPPSSKHLIESCA